MAGYKSLLAFWVGGASSVTPTTTGGVKSLLAPWVGGAAVSPTITTAGFRSLFGFWAGGAFAVAVVPSSPSGGGGYPRLYPKPEQIYNDDEEIMMVMSQIFTMIARRR